MSKIVIYSVLFFACNLMGQNVFINEIRSNDASTDDGEFIEIIGPAGAEVSGWSLTHYNGTGATIVFSFTFPESTFIPTDDFIGTGSDPVGFLVVKNVGHTVPNADFDWGNVGLQNGPDGVLLTDRTGTPVQALAWNGLGDLATHDLPWREIGSDSNDDRSLCAPDDVRESSAQPWVLANPTPGNVNNNQSLADMSLPVQLTSFTAQAGDGYVGLSWITAAEVNNMGFILERCEDGDSSFSEIASYLSTPALTGQGNTSRETRYAYRDETVFNGITYLYQLVDVDMDGIRTTHPSVSATPNAVRIDRDKKIGPEIPEDFRLMQNYPNPFNPSTRIRFQLPRDDLISIRIYNLTGQLITSIFQGELTAGSYELEWTARNSRGITLPAGVYFLLFNSTHFYAARRMVLAP